MWKITKHGILGFILGIILASSIGVIAYSISASDISFESANENFKATTVQEAMDELYSLTTKKFEGEIEFSMGSGTNDGGATGYRSHLVFNSTFFLEHIEEISAKKGQVAAGIDIRAAQKETAPYSNSIRIASITTSADYQKIEYTSFDPETYPYIYITTSTGTSTYNVAAYIKLKIK